MRKLMYLLILCSAVACKEQHDNTGEAPTLQKIEWHIHAWDQYTQPWLDSVTASVAIRIYKTDIVRKTSEIIWDTAFAKRAIRHYPVLPQKHIINREIPVLNNEKLQVWYNIRYEMNGSASEKPHMQIVQEPFTFVDVKL